MAIVIPTIKGKLGNTEYYETTMKVRDLVLSVRLPSEMDEWANFSIEERMQREPDFRRIEKELGPYIAKNKDRFFGSIIVLVYKGEVIFEPMSDLANNLPAAYRQNAQRIGFITIDGGSLIVLDGQHRLLALRKVHQHEIEGANYADISDDDVCVIFIQHKDLEKTRRIFNTVNRYAKQTSRGDNIITSEDDGYAIVTRRLLDIYPEKSVNWRSNTLTKRSTQITTISAVYETVKLILGMRGNINKLNQQERPSEEKIETFLSLVSEVWGPLLQHMDAYVEALLDLSKVPDMRKDEAETALLFKPASQIALVDGVLRAVKEGGLEITDSITRANKIPTWSMSSDFWQGIIIKQSGAIEAGSEARRRMASLLCYLIAADRIDDKLKFEIWKMFNAARGKDLESWIESGTTKGNMENLPVPVEGLAFTVKAAQNLQARISE